MTRIRCLTLAPSIPGETPPPPPRACFGRDELIESIVNLAENLTPLALIGTGGIGKTSIALTVLHHRRIKERFGDHRRFIRCDQFSASKANFLGRFSNVIGAGVENPEDLALFRPFLSSKEMLIVFDNAESVLDPQGFEGQEIYRVVKELSQFPNICVVITSRIKTTPPDCKRLDIPTLSIDAARSAFLQIYDSNKRPDLVDKILEQLDFHPLSVTLLATVAHQNDWDNDRLAREWEQHHTGVLQTEHDGSLAAAIELSLSSPMFKALGSDAREFLEVVAFFPQGVNEENLDWLFPTIPNRSTILDKFCILSLTYRSDGYITMLVPLRDYLCPKDPLSSPLLQATRDCYFTRMPENLNPDMLGFAETRWIVSEDGNVEHLLNVLTSIDTSSDAIWHACIGFLELLYWHKPRQTVLGPKIRELPDNHLSKPKCLCSLARSFSSVGNHVERKSLLEQALKLEREARNYDRVAHTLSSLSDTNRLLGLYEEGIQQAREALEICERIGDVTYQEYYLINLASLLYQDEHLDAAEKATFRAIESLRDKGEGFPTCRSHRLLGDIYRSKGERDKAVHHYETALGIASRFDWNGQLFWVNFSLALVFLAEHGFGDAHAHIEQAKVHAVNSTYYLGLAIHLQARAYYQQDRLEDATSGALRALEIFEKLGTAVYSGQCRDLLRDIEQSQSVLGKADLSGELLETILSPTSVDTLLG